MNLFKTSFLSAIETAIKLSSGFVIIKFIALKIGPEGVAYFGQFQNFLAAFILLISGGFTTGLVRYSAEESNNKTTHNYLGNALGLGLISALVAGAFIALFAKPLAVFTLKNSAFYPLFYLLAICGFLIMLYQVLIAVFNGWGELVKLIVCKSASSLLLLIIAVLLVYCYGLVGGLSALIFMQALSAFIAIFLITKLKNFHWRWLTPCFNLKIYKEFFPYWLMSVVTLISSPLILLLLRRYIASTIGWEMTGIWEASWKLSELYLLVITTALTTYYVPKLSKARNRLSELVIVKEVLILGVISACFLAFGVYFFRHLIITILFSSSFFEVGNILLFQLIGSIFKIAAWVFAYHMLVKRNTRLFLASELIFGASFYLISRICLDNFGLLGLTYAYALNYFFYLLFCSAYIYHYYFLSHPAN